MSHKEDTLARSHLQKTYAGNNGTSMEQTFLGSLLQQVTARAGAHGLEDSLVVEKEGFDVGMEMSGNASAFRDMLRNMAHGGGIAMLGIPSEEIIIDWREVIFNMRTIKGIYGREMYET